MHRISNAEQLLKAQTLVLEENAKGSSLSDVLNTLCVEAEGLLGADSHNSILLLKDKSLTHCAAPTLPKDYVNAINGIKIGPAVGSCGTAAYLEKTIIVTDIANDPLWANYKETAAQANLAACWSMPILSTDKIVLGTFATYYHTVKIPSDIDLDTISHFGHLAGLIIEKSKSEEAVIEREERLLEAQYIAKMGDFTWDLESGDVAWSDGMYKLLKYDVSEKIDYTKINSEIHHPDDLEKVTQWLEKTLSTGKEKLPPNEYRLVCKDGDVIYVHAEGRVEYRDGTPLKIFGICFDITKLKQTEKTLLENEEHYRSLAENSQDYIMRYDKQCRHLYQNAAAYNVSGFSKEEFIGKTHSELGFEKNLCDLWEDKINQVFKTKESTFEIFEWESVDGKVFLDWRLFPEFDKDGKVETVLAVSRDITEQKDIRDELTSNSDLLQAVHEANPDLQFVLDKNGTITNYHAHAHDDLYTIPEEFVGKTFLEVLPENVGKLFLDAFNTASATKSLVTIEYVLPMPSGDCNFEGRIVSLQDERVVVTVRNITERIKAEKERDRMQNELRQSQKMEAIGILTGGMAHEFNNLLTPILGYSDMLMIGKSEDNPDFAGLCAIQNAGNRAASLIQQLLAYGRKSMSQTKPVQLVNIVEDTVRLIEKTIPSNIIIKKEFEDDLPATLGMPNEIYQVILNLCINASHAMPYGGEMMICLKNAGTRKFTNIDGQSSEGDFLKLRVQDTGLGMSKDTMTRAFDPFFTTKDVGQGSGLGLSVVQGIVEQHGGHVEVDSTIGEGTVFDIYFPITQERVQATDEKIKTLSKGEGRILLVDDELMVIDLARSMLESLGYEVVDYIDCEEALDSFVDHSKEFDLVVTDFGMPKMNGKQLAEKLKGIRPEIPIILITGYGDLVTKEEISSWGLDGLLTKPFKLQELSEIARKVLHKPSAEL